MQLEQRLQNFLVKIKVINHDGIDYTGRYNTTGLNKKNPLSYLVFIIVCIIVAIGAVIMPIISYFKFIYREVFNY